MAQIIRIDRVIIPKEKSAASARIITYRLIIPKTVLEWRVGQVMKNEFLRKKLQVKCVETGSAHEESLTNVNFLVRKTDLVSLKLRKMQLIVPKNPQADWVIGMIAGYREDHTIIEESLLVKDIMRGDHEKSFFISPDEIDLLVRQTTSFILPM